MPDELLDTPEHAILRLAGVDPVAIARGAATSVERALASDDHEHALRAADQVWRLLGAYSRHGAADRSKVSPVSLQISLAPFAQPAPEPKALPAQAVAAPVS